MTRADWTLGVLLGGASQRMGQDKAFLKVGDVTLAEFSLRRCSHDDTPVILGVGEQGHPIPEGLQDFPQGVDRELNGGPLFGIEAMVALAQTTWLVVIPCDMPGLDACMLGHLVAGLSSSDDFGQFDVDGHVKVLPLAVNVAWAKAHLGEILDSGERRIVNFLRIGRGKFQPWDAARNVQAAFRNINTQSEFQEFVEFDSRSLGEDEP